MGSMTRFDRMNYDQKVQEIVYTLDESRDVMNSVTRYLEETKGLFDAEYALAQKIRDLMNGLENLLHARQNSSVLQWNTTVETLRTTLTTLANDLLETRR